MSSNPANPSLADRVIAIVRWLWSGSTRAAAPNDNPLGRKGEAEACRFLRKYGYKILARNVRVKVGEADIVALAPDASTVVIVEVKSREIDRTDPRSIPPEASLTADKRRKLRSVRGSLIRANQWQGRTVRIDAIAVERESFAKGRTKWTVRHHQDIRC